MKSIDDENEPDQDFTAVILMLAQESKTFGDSLREFACKFASATNNWANDVDEAIAEYACKSEIKEDQS